MYTADRTRCNDVKPNRAPQQAVVSGYPDPWSVSLSWKAPGGACVDFYYGESIKIGAIGHVTLQAPSCCQEGGRSILFYESSSRDQP